MTNVDMDEITLKDLPIELQITIYIYSINKHRKQWKRTHSDIYKNCLKMIPTHNYLNTNISNDYWQLPHTYQFECPYKNRIDVLNWSWNPELYTFKYIGSNKPYKIHKGFIVYSN